MYNFALINYDMYYPLISPAKKTDDNTRQQVQWVKYQISYLTTLFYRFVYFVTNNEHKWLNDAALYKRFKEEIKPATMIEKSNIEKCSFLAKELISRNPSENSKEINDKIETLKRRIIKKKPITNLKGTEIGKKDTYPKDMRNILLYPTLDAKLLEKYQKEEKNIYVISRRKELAKTVDAYRIVVIKNEEFEKLIDNGRLKATTYGQGGAYFLQHKKGKKSGLTEFILKPNGEGTFCLDNRKGEIKENWEIEYFTSYYHDRTTRVRNSIPLYCEVLSEVLYYEVAKLLGLGEYVPETFLAIVKSKEFFLRNENPTGTREVKEKLCSVQKFVTNQGRVIDLSKEKDEGMFYGNIDALSIAASIFLDCLCGNTDRYSENCLIKDKKLINIDNGLCFPENNNELRICNVLFKQAKVKFPDFFVTLINDLSDEKSARRENLFKLLQTALEKHENVALPKGSKYSKIAMDALKNRIEMMKWAIDKEMSMREVGLRVISLGKGDEARRDETITKNNVDPFQIGLEGNKSWKTITPAKGKKKDPQLVEIPVDSDDESDVLVFSSVQNSLANKDSGVNDNNDDFKKNSSMQVTGEEVFAKFFFD